VRLSKSKQLLHNQTLRITLVLLLIMNEGFSFDFSITCSKLFRVSWAHLGYIAGDLRQNLQPKFAPVLEQSEFSYSAYLVAAGHL